MNAAASLRQQLRVRTREAHDVLDRTLDLFERPLTLTQYGRLLGRFRGVHLTIEPLLARQLGPALLKGRSKLPAIEHDLRACGFTLEAIHALPRCDLLPPIDTAAAALAALYVIEGSTLGGRLIARSVGENTSIPRDACRYFDIYGDLTGTRWRAVCDALDQCSDPNEQAQTVAAAIAIFDSLRRWLDAPTWRG